ncbi:MAG: DUF3048 domain-containing protein [bacterium]|nr:DUF3048 domain-containing protein [bacterium]
MKRPIFLRVGAVVVAGLMLLGACQGEDEAVDPSDSTSDLTAPAGTVVTSTGDPTAEEPPNTEEPTDNGISASEVSSTTEAPLETTTTTTTTGVIAGSSSTISASEDNFPPSTTTTTLYIPVSPVSGLPVDDLSLLDRRLVAVKIDNHRMARPQSGIEEADGMIELVVEGGVTRFIALFHHSDSSWLGPMRSIRPTDWTLAKALNGVLVISGGQPWILNQVVSNDVPMIGDLGPPLTTRLRERAAPHNLYVNTFEARLIAEERNLDPRPPPALFNRGPTSASPLSPATYIFFDWTDSIDVVWHWDGSQYLRSTNGQSHQWLTQDGDSGPITADVLVVLSAERYTACPTGSGSCVPAWRTVDENRAVVFAEGRAEEGRWTRADTSDWFTLTGLTGEPIIVPPGRTWIMIYPETAELVW